MLADFDTADTDCVTVEPAVRAMLVAGDSALCTVLLAICGAPQPASIAVVRTPAKNLVIPRMAGTIAGFSPQKPHGQKRQGRSRLGPATALVCYASSKFYWSPTISQPPSGVWHAAPKAC